MYAAHKAAGGMTSIYRQIGIGCEHLFRQIIVDSLGLTDEGSRWSYNVLGANNKKRTLQLDARIIVSEIGSRDRRNTYIEWMNRVARQVGVTQSIVKSLHGAVFEVRQGYKSKDSKRQNADISNAATAYVNGYIPCVSVLSRQIDSDIHSRYRAERWVVLTGITNVDDPDISTYSFFRHIIGYDLAAFFIRNQAILRSEIESILRTILSTGDE